MARVQFEDVIFDYAAQGSAICSGFIDQTDEGRLSGALQPEAESLHEAIQAALRLRQKTPDTELITMPVECPQQFQHDTGAAILYAILNSSVASYTPPSSSRLFTSAVRQPIQTCADAEPRFTETIQNLAAIAEGEPPRHFLSSRIVVDKAGMPLFLQKSYGEVLSSMVLANDMVINGIPSRPGSIARLDFSRTIPPLHGRHGIQTVSSDAITALTIFRPSVYSFPPEEREETFRFDNYLDLEAEHYARHTSIETIAKLALEVSNLYD